MSEIKEVEISKIKMMQEVYPRSQIDTEQVNLYRTNIDELPPIILNLDNILIDGAHRLQAHEIAKKERIKAYYKDVPQNMILIEAIRYNSMHGKQLTRSEKKYLVRKFKLKKIDGLDYKKTFAISRQTIDSWTKDIRIKEKSEKDEQIYQLYLQCYTQVEIEKELSVEQRSVGRSIKSRQNAKIGEMSTPESLVLSDHWNFSRCDPQYGTPDYPGRAAGQILENFLHYCTNPFDIVVDPMAGGGTTGDVAKSMHRRYLMYDLHPLKTRPEIKFNDITKGYPEKTKNCNAIFLDPPYWTMKDADYKEGSVSSLNRNDFFDFMLKLVHDSYKVLIKGGFLGFLFQDSYNAVKGLYKTDSMFTAELFPFFQSAGFEPYYWISIPLSMHHQYDGTKTNIGKELKVPLHVVRHFIIFKKE